MHCYIVRTYARSARERRTLARAGKFYIDWLRRLVRRGVRRIHRELGVMLIDRRYRVDTWRAVDLSQLGLAHDDRVAYVASTWLDLRRAFRRIDVGPDDVFLDLGSGKGRTMLEAARHPFKRIIGVELSSELLEVAAANVEAARPSLRCQDIDLVESDVSDFRVPDDVTVAYAYNSFVGAVFEAAMQALIASYDRRPRRMHLIYLNPAEHDRLVGSGRFRLLSPSRRWRRQPDWLFGPAIHLYELRPATPVHSPGP